MKKLFALSVLALLSSCVILQQDYEVEENSEKALFAPSWIIPSKAHKAEANSNTKKYRYFVDKATDINQRICLKNSELNAMKKIATDVSAEIINRLKRLQKSKKLSNVSELQKDLEQNILVNLSDVSTVKEYWEKRKHLKEKGASKEYFSYKCDTVVKIKKTSLIHAIETYQEKTNKSLNKKELKDAISSYLTTLKIER